jgi:hypothetical protein
MGLMKITKTQRKWLIQACLAAIQNEEALIDAYSNVSDGSEKQPVSQSKKWIKKWKKIMADMGAYTETKPRKL